jgi:hypothetical protein
LVSNTHVPTDRSLVRKTLHGLSQWFTGPNGLGILSTRARFKSRSVRRLILVCASVDFRSRAAYSLSRSLRLGKHHVCSRFRRTRDVGSTWCSADLSAFLLVRNILWRCFSTTCSGSMLATSDLLEDLLSATDMRNLMLIGAYRDNEVDPRIP